MSNTVADVQETGDLVCVGGSKSFERAHTPHVFSLELEKFTWLNDEFERFYSNKSEQQYSTVTSLQRCPLLDMFIK